MMVQTFKADEMMSVAQVCEHLKCCKQHVYNLVDRGTLKPAFRFGGRRGLKIPREVVQRFAKESELDPGA